MEKAIKIGLAILGVSIEFGRMLDHVSMKKFIWGLNPETPHPAEYVNGTDRTNSAPDSSHHKSVLVRLGHCPPQTTKSRKTC